MRPNEKQEMAAVKTVTVESQEVRERVLTTAARLFVTHGYEGISMREIAAECRMSKAGLYYHFRDKEALFLAILDHNLLELETILQQAARQPGGTRVRLGFFVRAIFTALPAERRAIIRLASQEVGKLSPQTRADFDRRYYERFLGRLQAILSEGIQTRELREMDPHLAMWGLLGLMYPFFNPGQDWSSEEGTRVIDFILTIFLEGAAQHD